MSNVIYTDGAATKNGRNNAFSGIGVFCENTEEKISMNTEECCLKYGFDFEKHSNNVGELFAIYVALKEFKNLKDVIIYSDSMYSINCVTKWYKQWEKNDWTSSLKKPVKNKKLIQAILKEVKEYNSVFFIYTKAHQKEPQDKTTLEYKNWYGNDMADSLAKKAVNL